MQNLKEIWKSVVAKIEPVVGRNIVVTWFNNTALFSVENQIALIGVPSVFARDWMNSKYNEILVNLINSFGFDVEKVSYEIDAKLYDRDDIRAIRLVEDNKQQKTKTVMTQGRKMPHKEEVMVKGLRSKRLNNRYSLGNFIVGQSTRLAHAAASAVANRPGENYNPLFIYGGVGLGKTHLLHATGNAIIDNFPTAAVVYTTAENFVNEIVAGIKNFKMDDIKKMYRNIDCLIIDDIQFLGQRERTQEEFFHTFNELYDNHKQIILSSDRAPRELKGIEDRLRSRFEMGMIVDVSLPDYETRLAILMEKAQEQEAIIPKDVLEFIAYNVNENVRTLEGVLLQAIAKAKLENVMPTVKMVARYIEKFDAKIEIQGENHKYQPNNGIAKSIDDVIDIVCAYYKVSRNDLQGNVRRREYLMPRQVSMFLSRVELNQSFERIGGEFGGRNHTTVMHACEKIKELLANDHNLVRDVNAIKREMGL